MSANLTSLPPPPRSISVLLRSLLLLMMLTSSPLKRPKKCSLKPMSYVFYRDCEYSWIAHRFWRTQGQPRSCRCCFGQVHWKGSHAQGIPSWKIYFKERWSPSWYEVLKFYFILWRFMECLFPSCYEFFQILENWDFSENKYKNKNKNKKITRLQLFSTLSP